MHSRNCLSQKGIEGALPVLLPFPVLLWSSCGVPWWSMSFTFTVLAVMTLLLSSLTLLRYPRVGRFSGIFSVGCSWMILFPLMRENPFVALAATLMLLLLVFAFLDFELKTGASVRNRNIDGECLRAWWALLAVLPVFGYKILFAPPTSPVALEGVVVSWWVASLFYLVWVKKNGGLFPLLWGGVAPIVVAVLFVMKQQRMTDVAILLSCLVSLLSFPRPHATFEKRESWWDVLLIHPARVLGMTFLLLCALGSLLLLIPGAVHGHIHPIDSLFTSVSAVCVTGLVVLDTAKDFTLFGQFFILLLIQFGGLGIMSITTVAMHVMGRRMSLRQERLLSTMTDTDQQDLVRALRLILQFTFTIEGIGAVFLTLLFWGEGQHFANALWQGVFTAISAFCNAGFALQSQSMVPFQHNALLLHCVALLIIAGGIAPATCLALPRWLCGKKTPLAVHITLVTTLILLVTGTLFFLAFEWKGILDGLDVFDKIQNAWFQSVTLRTAGFNSVDLATMASPTLLLSLFLMFIGGSPGGTAGGVKSTTLGILVLTFRAGVRNCDGVVVAHRRISIGTVHRAITVVISGITMWFVVVLMLLATQQIPAKELIFEATSALATVGLSVGATAHLDEIGKIIIIIAMFVGRIGPMTLFTLLSDERTVSTTMYAEEKISLT